MSDSAAVDHATAVAAADLVFDRLEKPLDSIRSTLESIDRALYGESRAGFVGLVERVGDEERARIAGDEAIRKEVEEFRSSFAALERRFDRMIWTAIGIGFGSGAGGAWVVQVLSGS